MSNMRVRNMMGTLCELSHTDGHTHCSRLCPGGFNFIWFLHCIMRLVYACSAVKGHKLLCREYHEANIECKYRMQMKSIRNKKILATARPPT